MADANNSSEDSTELSEDSEPDDDDDDETDRVSEGLIRSKRALPQESSSGSSGNGKGPPSSARLATRPKWLPPGYKLSLNKGNPVYGFRMQLYCRTGFLLAIFPDKKVRGIDDSSDPFTLVEFSSVHVGEVRIKGIEAGLYLAMNKKGRLYGEANGKDEATVFVEYASGQYTLYLSRKWAHVGWYVGIKKSGKSKPGHQTRWGQKSIQFLPKRMKYSRFQSITCKKTRVRD